MAVKRALAVTGNNGRVIIITGKKHIPHVTAQAAKLSAAEKKRLIVIGEPAAKNTAPAIACAVVFSMLNNSNSGKAARNLLVLTSDHIIKPLEVFISDAALAAKAAADGNLVVFGIPPSRPETGYGYIEIGKTAADVYNVTAFHEKPDLQTAKKYAASKRFFWNSGMFAFNSNFISEQFNLFAPDVFAPFEKLKAVKSTDITVSHGVKIIDKWNGLENAFRKTLSISFDYAIAEKCKKTVMVRTNFDWIDVGGWEEYIKICSKQNCEVYSVPGENASNETCYVDSDIPVALAGVEDLIVVIRSGKNGEPATALITKKGQTQKVKEIVEKIKKAGKTELL
jgi:mannose-1-phosphate guanylyltransferase/mannose-1-phosphate guanylyltransferase/mannose-6-phosphate isomerase